VIYLYIVPRLRYLLGLQTMPLNLSRCFYSPTTPSVLQSLCYNQCSLTVLTIALPCRFSCTALIPVLPRTVLLFSLAAHLLTRCLSSLAHSVSLSVGIPPKVAFVRPSRSHLSQPFKKCTLTVWLLVKRQLSIHNA
jgi:hypothetical protein